MKSAPIILLALAAGSARAQTFCRIATWFNPTGASNAPFSNVAGAACATPSGGTLTIASGTYYDSNILLNTGTKTLTTTTGPVLIGAPGSSRSSLRVLSYSAHIFPAGSAYSRWADADRAAGIAQFVAQQRQAGVDLIGIQDYFDDDLAFDLAQGSNYTYRNYANGQRSGAPLGGGLLSFANMTNVGQNEQGLYSTYTPSDSAVSRSFFRLSYTKDGFNICHFNTSLQRGTSGPEITVRASQMQLLAAQILAYRQANPADVVIVTASMNARDTATEYTTTMSNQLGGVSGAADVAPNLACAGAGVSVCTACAQNELRTAFGGPSNVRLDYIFYADSFDGRTRIIPKTYEVLHPAAPQPISAAGFNADTQTTFQLNASTQLSDHEAIVTTFDLVHN